MRDALEARIGDTVLVRFPNGHAFDGELLSIDDLGLSIAAVDARPGSTGPWSYFIPWTAMLHVSAPPPGPEARSVPIALAKRQAP